MEREEVVAALFKAAGGELIGRVRLQKAAYLLDRLGLKSGFRYSYHHYGPFSRDLDNAVADAKAFGLVIEEFERRQVDGARYSIFRLAGDVSGPPVKIGQLDEEMLAGHLQTFANTNVTVLEVAATANWLVEQEKREDWREALRRRKGLKVEGGRLDRALALLRELGLPPATTGASA